MAPPNYVFICGNTLQLVLSLRRFRPCFHTANQILQQYKDITITWFSLIGRADGRTEPDCIRLHNTRANDSEQQPTLAFLLKSPSYLTYKHEQTSCPAP